MNVALMKRNYIIIKKLLFLLVGLSIVGFLFFGVLAKIAGGIFAGIGSIFFGYFLVQGIFEKEEKNRGFYLLIAMPYEREEIVKTIYQLVFGLTLIVTVVLLLMERLLGEVAIINLSYKGLGIMFGSCLLLLSMLIPILFRYGYAKGIMFGQCVLLGSGMLVVLFARTGKLSWQQIQEYNFYRYDLLCFFLGVIGVFVSYMIAKRIFVRKDF